MFITQGVRRAAQVNGGGIATIDGERRRTWSQFTDRVARLAGGLLDLGLQPDDRVAMLALNSDRYLEYYFAVIWAGGIFVPINTRLAPPEIGSILTDAGPMILVVDDVFQAQLTEALRHSPPLRTILFAGEGQPRPDLIEHESLIVSSEPAPDARRGGADAATIIYTGGTTARAKGVMLSHNNIVSNALSSLALMHDEQPWTYLHAAPMFHIADSQWNSGVTMHAGTHVFAKKFVPEEILDLISRHAITHTALVPTMINMLCNVPDAGDRDVSSLRKINFGGSPIAPTLIKRARQMFPGCKFIQGYGQTETAPNISMLLDQYNTDQGPHAGKIKSAGQAVFAMEIRIVDPADEEVPAGTIGEITTRGPHVMLGYWNQPEETARALRGGWMHTGDLGYLDQEGFVFIVDRLKDMIISGGENVYSAEVEHVIYQHPAVAECAIIGIPDEKWGEAVYAIIVPKSGHDITERAIIEHCHRHLAGYKCPRRVEFRREPMPLSGPGKILKKALRARFWPNQERKVG
jgi:long-chain acyl-CoA synthetase